MTEELPLLHLDDRLAAIDKPPGLLVHRTSLDAHEADNALDRLQRQLGCRLWPLHRLDKGTSGVLLFARDTDTASQLGRAWAEGAVAKRYLALVRGWPPEQGRVDHPLARDPERPSQGQPLLPARTDFRRLHCIEWPFAVDGRHATSRYALLELQPHTGRRHQIRRHMKHIAHPLVGDSTHGKGAHNRAAADWLGVSRLWLHASELVLPAAALGRELRLDAPPGAQWRPLAPA